jgi:dipeptidyl-peptidase-4
VSWSESGPLTLLVMDRAQQHESLRAADVATGETRELLAEQDPAWINLPEGAPRWLGAKDGFLWIAERDDTGPWLEWRNADGSLRSRLTPANLRVLRLLAVDAARAFAYVSATDDARERHVYKVALKARMLPQRLSRERGIEDASFTADCAVRVRTLLPERGAAMRVIEDANGKALATPKSIAESPESEPNAEFTRTGSDSFAVCIVRPRDFDPRRRYPVIDDAYGGPHVNQVQRAGRMLFQSQWLADQGFIVVRIDGRGTPGRGRSWERAIRYDLISLPLADHVSALKSLCAEHPEMDGEKIGVTGGSFGGYFSVLAVERAPETYKAAYALAPVIDWHDYDTFYTERYLGVPPADSAAYTRSSALTDAAKLSRPLFVVHGTADDNVYFFNSLKLADALNRAGKDWRFMPMPGQTHGVRDPALMRQNLARRTQFFRESLGMPGDAAPPRP